MKRYEIDFGDFTFDDDWGSLLPDGVDLSGGIDVSNPTPNALFVGTRPVPRNALTPNGRTSSFQHGSTAIGDQSLSELAGTVQEAEQISSSNPFSPHPAHVIAGLAPFPMSALAKGVMGLAAEERKMEALDRLMGTPEYQGLDIAQAYEKAMATAVEAPSFMDNLLTGPIGFGSNFTAGPPTPGTFGTVVGTVQIADDVNVPAYDPLGLLDKEPTDNIGGWDPSFDPKAPPGFGPNNPVANGGGSSGGGTTGGGSKGSSGGFGGGGFNGPGSRGNDRGGFR